MAFTKLLAGQRIAPERTFRIPLPLPQLGAEPPALLVRHCGEENPAFYNAWRKRMIMRGPSPATQERLQREVDAPILGELGIAGFEHIYEDSQDGAVAPAEFSPAKAAELLIAIASESPSLFEMIRNIVHAEHLFRDPAPSAEAVGKG